MAEKLMFMVTHGPDHPEHVTIPFVMAVAALASDVEAVIGLQADGVELGVMGRADSVAAEGFPRLSKLMNDYKELGGKILAANLPIAYGKGGDIRARYNMLLASNLAGSTLPPS